MALPIGYAVDRINRTYVLGTGIFLWSLMTALAGLANSFGKLFGARIGVAVGEAVLAPTSVSLVSDYFAEDKQGKPLGIITSGPCSPRPWSGISNNELLYFPLSSIIRFSTSPFS